MSDEIYAELAFKNADRQPSISKYARDRTIITSAISKCHGAGGWRLGFSIYPDALEAEKNAILRVASETYSCVAAPIQHAAVAAYALDNEDLNLYKRDSARILEAVGNRTTKKLLEHDIKVHYPEGGFYVYPDFSNYKEAINTKLGTNSSKEFFKIMLE